MTQKEREKLEDVIGEIDSQSMCENSLEIGKLISKEVAKYFRKKGYDVSKENFEPVIEIGRPARIEFVIGGVSFARFSFLTTSACDKWLSNNLSLFKSLKECDEVAFDDRYSNCGRSFKEFLRESKAICMQQNLYEPSSEYKGVAR